MTADQLIVTGNTAHTQPENRLFFPALDGLRAVAFLLVFFTHYAALPWGFAGVNIFFVLSGFLITGILFDSRGDPCRARNFYIRRTLRIFPLYYAVFLVLLLLAPILHWQWTLSWLAWPLYLGNFLILRSPQVMVINSPQAVSAFGHLYSARFPVFAFIGHFWSICVEEQFYLFWPAIVFLTRSRRALIWVCGITVVVVPLLRELAQHTAPAWMLQAEMLYRITPFQLDSLLLGGLIALLWRGVHRGRLLAVARIVAWLCAVVAVVYLAVTVRQSMPDWAFGYRYPSWMLTGGLTFINIFSASLILCALNPAGLVYRLLRVRALRWLGRISYGAYVFHDIPHHSYIYFVAHLGLHIRFVAANPMLCTILVALCATLLISWLSFRFYESRFLNLKERWTARPAV